MATTGALSHQPFALSCQPQRGRPANLATESLPNASEMRWWPAVMAPRHAGLGATDVVASHRAADGAGPPIEAARTYAHFTSRGAAASFPAFRSTLISGRDTPNRPIGLAHFFPRRIVSQLATRLSTLNFQITTLIFP